MSYITVGEADLYVSEHYLPSEPLRTYWDSLDEASKLILLRRSFDKLERLPYKGQKYDPAQTAQFPRNLSTTVPQAVKDAQIVEALASSNAVPANTTYRQLRQRGVKAYSIGQLSETFNASGSFGDALNDVSAETLSLLGKYIFGGYSIC